MDIDELPVGYAKAKLARIIDKAKEKVEEEYGGVFLPEIFYQQLIEHCRRIAKEYNAKVAYEEMQRMIIDFIKVR